MASRLASFVLACVLAFNYQIGQLAAVERPNVLFIYTDDQRWDALGVVQREQGDKARFPWFETPNLDRLAGEGVRFRNAFVVNSLCAPSRSVNLTGRYSHLNGVANNHTPFPSENISSTWSSLLKQAGYTTGYIGKFHHGQQTGQRPGFDYSASFTGQGRYTDCPFEVDGKTQETTGWVDDVSTDFALNFLGKNKDKSFALVVGYKSAHGPFQPPPRLAEKYAGKEARPTPNVGIPAIYAGKFAGGTLQADAKPKKKKADGSEKPKAGGSNMLRGYFGCLAAVDENVGRLLARLDELKLTEDTVVIFTSDNGYYLGEHNLGDKRSAYEESIRVPMLVRYPKLGDVARGRTSDSLVLNLDLAPSLLDLAGEKVPEIMQGRSWRRLLTNPVANGRDAFFYEYFYERSYAIPTVLAVRTQNAKLIKYPGHGDWTELFDLSADPYETRNLVSDAPSKDLLAAMQAEFDKQAKAVDFRIPDYADPVPEQGKP